MLYIIRAYTSSKKDKRFVKKIRHISNWACFNFHAHRMYLFIPIFHTIFGFVHGNMIINISAHTCLFWLWNGSSNFELGFWILCFVVRHFRHIWHVKIAEKCVVAWAKIGKRAMVTKSRIVVYCWSIIDGLGTLD